MLKSSPSKPWKHFADCDFDTIMRRQKWCGVDQIPASDNMPNQDWCNHGPHTCPEQGKDHREGESDCGEHNIRQSYFSKSKRQSQLRTGCRSGHFDKDAHCNDNHEGPECWRSPPICCENSKDRSHQNEPSRTNHRKQVGCSSCSTAWADKFHERVNRRAWIDKSCGGNECDTQRS